MKNPNFRKIFFVLFLYIFLVNIFFTSLLPNWKQSMTLFTYLQTGAVLIPLTIIVFLFLKSKKR
jgi:hypothetical protein